MHQNLFNGTFPKEIGNLSNLEELGMAYNPFVPMEIPLEFGFLKKLWYLWMKGTNLIGEIPENFNNLSSLQQFDLSINNLEGPIPSDLFSIENLTIVYLFKNHLSNEIPREINALNLVEVDLSQNNLTGSIPEGFGKLQSLRFLNLFSNQLTGGDRFTAFAERFQGFSEQVEWSFAVGIRSLFEARSVRGVGESIPRRIAGEFVCRRCFTRKKRD
ncbi:hypothetical protein HRI_004699100 [Hibiscus trionum]|uniref:Uncharacterized protein n=1 Tax=Hibiscus trionum TaxID=183268 RepID=A0A9W7MPU5_HIBTR|nr:hypothetical protein HRI_004699100 [Hibiscus trionum]